ncbi:TlpA family protein disulfide reductase [Reichenbachiella ulvae]|uniref:Thioredoxin family protein n=1 Tax=Reichenbachiella ulvae TaxID=2980104 RepID=A0ABT3CPQ1_9BACT|nr:thioredoxin family protein [Reichenbachiella ulvae]MCV9385700.1 thioredoxin family protein [Reichenbachiella ulvae]
MLRKLIAGALLLSVILLLGFLFWEQELQYSFPTPVPNDYQIVPVNQSLVIPDSSLAPIDRPVFYHFFKPGCPCSRFNVKHFNSLKRKFESKMDFVVVVPEGSDFEKSLSYFDKELTVTIDQGMKLAHTFGVYSTPQAVIVNTDRKLFYRGNYNKARYCTDPGSNFAQMAIDSLMMNRNAPDFGLLSTISYGCGLPDNEFKLWKLTL